MAFGAYVLNTEVPGPSELSRLLEDCLFLHRTIILDIDLQDHRNISVYVNYEHICICKFHGLQISWRVRA